MRGSIALDYITSYHGTIKPRNIYGEGYMLISNIYRCDKDIYIEAIELLGYKDLIEIREDAYDINNRIIEEYIALICKKENKDKINSDKIYKLVLALESSRED